MSGDEKLLSYDPATGMKEWFSSSDDNGGTWNIRYEQDVSPLLDANKSAQADSWDKRDDMWHAASIPNVVIMEWMTKYGINLYDQNHKEGVKRLLNSDEYRYLRVRNFIM